MNSTRTKRLAAPAVLLLMSASLSVPAPAQAAKPAAKTHRTSHHTSKKARKPHGQQAIDGERARQIQAALVREHYMNGEPSGKWDDATQAAMRRYQADQGWQSKSTPDSRALIRLGLGPDHGRLLNPESAMVSEPQLTGGTSSVRTSFRPRAAAPVAAKPAVAPRNSSPVSLPATALPNVSPSR